MHVVELLLQQHHVQALAEQLLLEESVGLPVIIIRPSIVTAAWREPFPGIVTLVKLNEK